MTHKILVMNMKGGASKTTTSVNLAAALSYLKKKTLLLDLDPQGQVAFSLGLDRANDMERLLTSSESVNKIPIKIDNNLHVIRSEPILWECFEKLDKRNNILTKRLNEFKEYEFIIMDGSPSLNPLSILAMQTADYVLVPLHMRYLHAVGLQDIIWALKRYSRGKDMILGVIPSTYDVRTKETLETVDFLKNALKDKITPPIRICAEFSKAQRKGETIFEAAPNSNGAFDYVEVVKWILERIDY